MKTHWFPLIRPAIKPVFLGAGTWPGGDWLISHKRKMTQQKGDDHLAWHHPSYYSHAVDEKKLRVKQVSLLQDGPITPYKWLKINGFHLGYLHPEIGGVIGPSNLVFRAPLW